MELINRAINWTTYTWSTVVTGVGMATQRDWMTAAGVLTGVVVAILGELHRRRMARLQHRNNALLNELIGALRDDTENRQDVREMIKAIREAQR